MMKAIWLSAAMLLTTTPLAAKPAAKAPAAKVEAQVSEGQTAQAGVANGYRYLLHIPLGYKMSKAERWPLIIFLHGSGERGTDIDLVKVHGPPKIAAADPAFPFIVISPQLPADQIWEPAKLDAMLDQAIKDVRIDTSRVYLTGLSLGGMGTWDWAAARLDRFAAIAPIAARANLGTACQLRDMPIWVFHGDSDPAVPAKGDIDMVQAIEQCGGKPRLTIYPATGHDSWSESYANDALYMWFLRHRRGGPE